MDKFFYYFYLISLLLLFYLIGFLTFKYDFYPKSWLNGSINLFLKDLNRETRKNILNFFKLFSENEENEEFNYTIERNKINNKVDLDGYLFVNLALDKFERKNISLFSKNKKKVFSWDFANTIKPKIALNLDRNGNLLVYNDEYVSLISNESKEVWKTKVIIHHWGTVYKNKLYVPGRKYENYPEDLPDNAKNLNVAKCKVKNALADTIVVINMVNGSIEKQINLLPIIASHPILGTKLGYSKKLFSKLKTDREDSIFESSFLGPSYCDDLLHLNDVKILQKKDLKYFNQSKIGDYLLSLHTLNAIVLIDHETLKVKWYLRDKMKRQHSPNITKDGYLIIFDNKGSDKKYGKSRIIKYDLKNQKFDSYFDGNKDFYFESSIRGRVQLFNNKIFVTSSQQGEIFRLDCETTDLKKCIPTLLFNSFNDDKPNSIFVGDFYSKNYFNNEFLKKLRN